MNHNEWLNDNGGKCECDECSEEDDSVRIKSLNVDVHLSVY